jgi:hypothetical protein
MSSRRAGLAIALAAILVQAPRLVLVLLAADRLPVAAAAERALLVVAGIGTALVLTGGNLYLAHTVAQVKAWRRTLAVAWIAVLAASGGLVIPLVRHTTGALPALATAACRHSRGVREGERRGVIMILVEGVARWKARRFLKPEGRGFESRRQTLQGRLTSPAARSGAVTGAVIQGSVKGGRQLGSRRCSRDQTAERVRHRAKLQMASAFQVL